MVAPFQATVSCIILHSRCSRHTEAEVVNKPKKMSYSDSNKQNNNNNKSSNNNSSRQRKSNSYLLRKVNFVVVVAIWSIMTLAGLTLVHGAAVYSNADFLAKSAFEQICNDQEEHFIESDGRQSSVIIEFNPNVLTDKRKSCTRILSAPFNYGFIVRLILPKYQHHQLAEHNTKASQRGIDFDDGVDNDAAAIDDIDDADVMNVLLNDAEHSEREKPLKPATKSALTEMTTLIEKLNATVALKKILGRSCPLQVFSSLDPHTPQWRLDPCQLEDAAPEMDDPVRLMHGRVRIVWEHSGHTLKSKLMITALGKGEQCRAANKHPCLKIGEEPLLCISQDLVCDGIRHCPNSNEYNSDEDYGLCWRRKHVGEPLPTHIESVLFEHFALEVFRNLFLFDVTYPPGRDKKQQHSLKHKGETATLPQGLNVTTLRKVNGTVLSGNETLLVDLTLKENMDNGTTTVATTPGQRRNNTRHSLHTDLSKYGPWGYLMLGMLLCGGALLICGLWASASQQAAQNERESALANAAAANGISIDHSSAATSPPNYEELDPPPAYSVLFPNQKTASTATLSAMPGAAEAAGATPLSPSSRPACSGVAGLALRTTIAQALSTTTNSSSAATTTASTAPAEVSSTAGSSSQDSSQLPN